MSKFFYDRFRNSKTTVYPKQKMMLSSVSFILQSYSKCHFDAMICCDQEKSISSGSLFGGSGG